MKKFRFSLVKAVLLSLLMFPIMANAETFAVIVNKANAMSADKASMTQTLRRLYLADTTSWPNGEASRPILPDESAAAYQAMLDTIIGMSGSEWATHWVRLKQQTGQTPPQSFNERMAIRVVERSAGGVAVVPVETAKGSSDVRVLMEFTN